MATPEKYAYDGKSDPRFSVCAQADNLGYKSCEGEPKDDNPNGIDWRPDAPDTTSYYQSLSGDRYKSPSGELFKF